MKTIFVIRGQYGMYSDTTRYHIGAFSRRIDAEEEAEKAFNWWRDNIILPLEERALETEPDWPGMQPSNAMRVALTSPHGHADHIAHLPYCELVSPPMYFFEQHEFEILEIDWFG